MRSKNRIASVGSITCTIALGVSMMLTVLGARSARCQLIDQTNGYVVVWKSRYNERSYRSAWYYADRAIADGEADEIRQFHAFKDVRVVTLPVDVSPDGISRKVSKEAMAAYNFPRRGTDAFTVIDLWTSAVPGAPVAGDLRVISLRRADSSAPAPAAASSSDGRGASSPAGGSRRSPAPVSGGAGIERLTVNENAPNAETASPPRKRTQGTNAKLVEEDVLKAKGEVLGPEKQRLDQERERLNPRAAAGQPDSGGLKKYKEDLKSYATLVSRLEGDLKSHETRFCARPARPDFDRLHLDRPR